MRIELKILNKQFYNEESNGMLLNSLPGYQTLGSAAIDLVCTEDLTLYPGETKLISTGIAVHIGSGVHSTSFFSYAGLILPRSGLGTKGLILANTIGLIDEDYQGELMVSALNRNEYTSQTLDVTKSVSLRAGDRFAQLMIIPVIKAEFGVVEEFSSSTNRGEGNFGSTGI